MVYGTVASYPTPNSLQDKVNEYFDTCFVEEYSEKYSRYLLRCIKPPTLSGLARYLGFSTRAELLRYHNKDERYESVIDEAKLRVEEYLETQLITTKGNAAGVIFALKNNAQWEEQSKQTVTTEGTQPLVLTWSASAEDVIDVAVEKPALSSQSKGALPVGGGTKISTEVFRDDQ